MKSKIIRISSWVLLTAFVVLSLAFANEARKAQSCSGLVISIDTVGNHEFITEDDVIAVLNDKFDSVVGLPLAMIDINKIETILNNNPYIKRADVYETINGKVGINITQRNPLFRIIGYGGFSFYYDEDGYMMPLCDQYSARVPLVTCDSVWKRKTAETLIMLSPKDTLEKADVLIQLYELTKYIKQDTLFNALIDQIHLTKEGEFLLIPRVSRHIVEFGGIEDYKEKLDKLILFYQRGLNAVGWNTYSRINIKYKNQVVCNKK
ncbi:MAG: hypothetical protein WCK02_11230 [Bacteroidota bacterium]